MCSQSRFAILCIHGILGKPEHFAPYIPLVPPDWSICNIQLKGHCGGVKEFSRARMSEWKAQVRSSLDKLREEHDRVIIAAHSMGTLFAIQEAIRKPVAELFLLNVPLRIRVTRRLFSTAWKVYRGNVDPSDVRSIAAQNAYSVEIDRNIFRYAGWIPRYLELFGEIRKTVNIVHELLVPAHIYLSAQDEMVAPESCKFFLNNACAEVKMLNSSGHYYYSPEDQSLLIEDFKRMIRETISFGSK